MNRQDQRTDAPTYRLFGNPPSQDRLCGSAALTERGDEMHLYHNYMYLPINDSISLSVCQ